MSPGSMCVCGVGVERKRDRETGRICARGTRHSGGRGAERQRGREGREKGEGEEQKRKKRGERGGGEIDRETGRERDIQRKRKKHSE